MPGALVAVQVVAGSGGDGVGALLACVVAVQWVVGVVVLLHCTYLNETRRVSDCGYPPKARPAEDTGRAEGVQPGRCKMWVNSSNPHMDVTGAPLLEQPELQAFRARPGTSGAAGSG